MRDPTPSQPPGAAGAPGRRSSARAAPDAAGLAPRLRRWWRALWRRPPPVRALPAPVEPEGGLTSLGPATTVPPAAALPIHTRAAPRAERLPSAPPGADPQAASPHLPLVLQLTLQATGDALLASHDGHADEPVLFINEQMLQLWGLPRDAGPGLTPLQLRAAIRPLLRDAQREATRLRQILALDRPHEDQLELIDGRVFLRRCVPAPSDGDRRRLRVWSLRDISGQSRAEAALHAARADARRAAQLRSDMVVQLSTALRTPLAELAALARGLQDAALAGADTPAASGLRQLRHGQDQLLALTDDLLDLARAEAGRLRVRLQALPLLPLAQDCMARVQAEATARRMHLSVMGPPADPFGPDGAPDADDGGPWLVADPQRLRQVLLTVLRNALRYHPGGGHLRLSWLQRPHGVLHIAVEDDGPGLSQQAQELLFHPFAPQAGSPAPLGSAGVGLALARRLVELMQGRLGISSAPGRGSRLWIDLREARPTAQRQPGARPRPRPARGGASAGSGGGGTVPRRVLCVGEDPVQALLLQGLLKQLPDVQLDLAANPAQAAVRARSLTPDLLLLDLQRPEGAGPPADAVALLRQLRAEPALASVPAVAIAADDDAQAAAQALAAGLAAWLPRPLQASQLLGAVQGHLASTAAGAAAGNTPGPAAAPPTPGG